MELCGLEYSRLTAVLNCKCQEEKTQQIPDKKYPVEADRQRTSLGAWAPLSNAQDPIFAVQKL